jgi:hypothetical protein
VGLVLRALVAHWALALQEQVDSLGLEPGFQEPAQCRSPAVVEAVPRCSAESSSDWAGRAAFVQTAPTLRRGSRQAEELKEAR